MMEVSSTLNVPRSPDTSLLLTKRRCPFGESPRGMKVSGSINSDDNTTNSRTGRGALSYENIENGGESAFQILMQSQQNQHPDESSSSPMTSSKCWLCEKHYETMPCAFCERAVCEMCVRQCTKCFGVFCSCCATVKYDSHEDRALCLGCNSEELKKKRVKAVPCHRVWKG
ncbi:uncharacterized protein LOC110231866 [Exaiptasia diaphana]|uniref:Uncharacterized protein n=1 Tax=Exaiptasia diaphana TaxID=2652724 RepID=A0A913WQK1_EXADI|nr:uncharacterized protein LOC110231866 [Exaiptasia diaphana]KXJ18735.1 hypothetical protein AC249_AIPGENE13395 [Exaiptasia diaphana]